MKQTTAQKAKIAGFKSLSDLAVRWGVTTQTLRNWDKDSQVFFDDALSGAEKRQQMTKKVTN